MLVPSRRATLSPDWDAASSVLSGTVDAGTIGTKSVTFTAYDNAGRSATVTCNYSVVYDFAGYFQPVDNIPVCNTVKAGQAIPMKFSLHGYQGLNIIASGYPTSTATACSALQPTDAVEQTTTAGNSSLSYDPTVDQYNYACKD